MSGKYRKTFLVMALDILLIVFAGGLALLTRFDFAFSNIPSEYADGWVQFLPIQLAVTVAIFCATKMYRYIWHSISVHDVAQMFVSILLANVVCILLSLVMGGNLPKSVYFIQLLLQLMALLGMRCSLRFWEVISLLVEGNRQGGERIMLIGAGEAGNVLTREINSSNKVKGKICCIIDDDPSKKGRYLGSARVVGGREEILNYAKKERITQILFAIPTATPQERKAILDICKMTGCRLRILPGIYQLLSGEVSLEGVKDVQVEDLLGRAPIQLNLDVLNSFLNDRTVLVTGGGGSIGSELCRQIARYRPRKLIILDIYENNAYDLQQELRRTWGSKLNLTVEIASVRDKEQIYEIFRRHRPDLVFHAAAHKHVPLMEECPSEAVKNNIFGTYHVVRAAEKFGVKKFVMISTDKAVNPTNFMGATKRFCEMILQSRGNSTTEFAAVRFGNVLGSNGSVVPLFKRQIENGGPVTITDKRIIRYFMTIPEASQLVLEAGAIAKQGQVFVLDMGEPVKILTLAENLIRLSGLEPYRDIDIQEIGLRPGEKLYEELLMASNDLGRTANEKIYVEQQERIIPGEIMANLIKLDEAVTQTWPNEDLIALLRDMVPTYHDPDEINRKAVEHSEEIKVETPV